MKIKDNDYYEKLYARLLKAYEIKRNNHNQVAWYNRYSKSHPDYKDLIYKCFDNNENIKDFGFQFNSEEELLINLDLRGI